MNLEKFYINFSRENAVNEIVTAIKNNDDIDLIVLSTVQHINS